MSLSPSAVYRGVLNFSTQGVAVQDQSYHAHSSPLGFAEREMSVPNLGTERYRVFCRVGANQSMLVGTDTNLKDAYKRCTSMENMEQWHIKMFLPVKEELEDPNTVECLVAYTDPKEGEEKITFVIRRAAKED